MNRLVAIGLAALVLGAVGAFFRFSRTASRCAPSPTTSRRR
jgi:hypothetical protein